MSKIRRVMADDTAIGVGVRPSILCSNIYVTVFSQISSQHPINNIC